MADPTKREIRRERRARRREIAATRDRGLDDRALVEHGLAVVARHGLGAGDTVTLYEATEVEPPTEGLTAALQARGIRVLVPITDPDLDLDWHDAADARRTPLGKEAIADAALALTPGLSVAPDGTRLGQGGGCYDKALPRRTPGVQVVVLLHPGEVAVDLPREPHDEGVDGILTAEGFSPVGSARE